MARTLKMRAYTVVVVVVVVVEAHSAVMVEVLALRLFFRSS